MSKPTFNLDNAMTQNLYDSGAEHYSKQWPDLYAHLSESIGLLKKLIPQGGSILDLGCGHGRDLAFWNQLGYQTVGIDFSKNLLSIAKQRHPNSQYYNLNISQIDQLPYQFDLIYSSYSWLHLDQKELASLNKKIYRQLKPHGYFFLATGIANQTITVDGNSSTIGLTNEANNKICPYILWSKEDLIQFFAPYFSIKWEKNYKNPFGNDPSKESWVAIFKKLERTNND